MNTSAQIRIAVTPALVVLVATLTSCLSPSDAEIATEVHKPAADSEREPVDWPRFLGPRQDGSAVATRPFDFSAEPTLVWSIRVGDGYGMGSIREGRYLQMDATPGGPTGVRSERLRCFDFANAQLLWSESYPISYRDTFGYEDGPRASPTIAEGVVYTLGVTGVLTARRLDDGSQLWQVDTSARYGVVQNFFGVASSPLVCGDQVIVMVGGSPPEDQDIPPSRLDRVSPNGTAVVSFDAKTGIERWKCGNDLASYSSPIVTKIKGREWVLVLGRGGLLAIDSATGKLLWRYDHRASMLESINAIVPVIDDDRIFISECYEVGSVLLDASGERAQVVWKDPPRNRRSQAMRCHWSTPVLVEGYLYGCSGRNAPDSDFRCIDFHTGKVQWHDRRRIRSSVTRLGDHLLVMEERGLLQVLKANPDQRELVAQWDLGEASGDRPPLEYPCWSAPIVVDDKVLVRGNKRVLCLQLASE